MNNTYKIKHKGVTYENPLVKVLEVAKEKGIDYEASLDLIPDGRKNNGQSRMVKYKGEVMCLLHFFDLVKYDKRYYCYFRMIKRLRAGYSFKESILKAKYQDMKDAPEEYNEKR